MFNVWYAAIATGIVLLIVGYFLLQSRKEAKKKQDELQRQLQEANEERSLLEKKHAEWREQSGPLMEKLAQISTGASFPILDKDDYLSVSHLFEDAGEGVEFIMQCDSYNAILQDAGMIPPSGKSGDNDASRQAGHSELTAAAAQIQVLLDKQMGEDPHQ